MAFKQFRIPKDTMWLPAGGGRGGLLAKKGNGRTYGRTLSLRCFAASKNEEEKRRKFLSTVGEFDKVFSIR